MSSSRSCLTAAREAAAALLRRERVEQGNRDQAETFSMMVPPDIFELAGGLWEPQEDDECAGP
jgi:hypothetical protein